MILLFLCQGVYIAFRAVSKPEEEESTVLAQLDEIHKVF